MSRTRALSNKPPADASWSWHLRSMRATLTFRALGIHARRVLDFLEEEHMAHGGRENGELGASYGQLAAWGVSRDDIRKGIEELIAGGFVRRTSHGLRQAGGGDPSRFALTWLPTGRGLQAQPATNDWELIARQLGVQRVTTVQAARAWLTRQVRPSSRGTAVVKAKATKPPALAA